ncbi:hypothetical protein ACK1XN_005091, partial [Salmonella enterica]
RGVICVVIMMLILCIVIPDVYLGCVWETDNIVRLRYRGRVPPVATGTPVQKTGLPYNNSLYPD